MKRSTPFLIVTLSANVILAALVISAVRRGNVQRPPTAKTENQFVETANNATSKSQKNYSLSPDLWGALDSDDLWTLAQRLRAAGFPAKAVRRLIWDLNTARGEIARAAIQGKRSDTPYWKNTLYLPDDPASRDKIREINQQGNRIYQKLMVDPEMLAEDDEMAFFARSRFGDLSMPKLQHTAKIWVDYMDLRSNVYASAEKIGFERSLSSVEREKLALLASEEQRDLKQALTPEEYAEFQYRSSPTADRLRDQLEVFRPTEQEYKTIFALQKSVDEQFKLTNESDTKTKQAYTDAVKALGPQVEAALGPDRYAEYLQAMDQTNNKLKRLVSRLGLPLTTVSAITAVQTDISQRAEAIQKDQTTSPADRAERLGQLVQEAQTKLTRTLGDSGYAAYEEAKGAWLRALSESATPTTP